MAWDRRHPGHGDDHPERLLCAAVRRAIVPTVFLPVAVAFVGASATGTGIPLVVSLPLAALVVIVSPVCWHKVIVLWRALPRREDDDDQRWDRWRDGPDPLGPSGGPDGISFDWARFEQQFWTYVRASASSRPPNASRERLAGSCQTQPGLSPTTDR